MKFLRVLLILVVVLIAAWMIAAVAGPREYDIKRTRVMDASQDAVFGEVADFRQWSGWSYWEQMDSTIQNTYSANQAEAGASMSWTSASNGNGKMEIEEVYGKDSIDMVLTFEGFEPSDVKWWFIPADEGTEVSVSMYWEIPFLMRPMVMLMGGKDPTVKAYDEGLANIAAIAEAKPKVELPDLAVSEEEMEDLYYIGIRYDRLTQSEITAELYGDSFERLMAAAGDHFAGTPMGITHHWDEEKGITDLEIAIPVTAAIDDLPEGINNGTIPAGNSVSAMHYGAYEEMTPVYDGLMQYMNYHGYEPRWACFELYVTDPSMDADTAKWATKVIFPI